MFIRKKALKAINKTVAELKMENVVLGGEIDELKKKLPETNDTVKARDLVECDVCGCLLKWSTAIKGKAVVKVIPIRRGINGWFPEREVIHHPYYCKVHAPKPPKPKGKK